MKSIEKELRKVLEDPILDQSLPGVSEIDSDDWDRVEFVTWTSVDDQIRLEVWGPCVDQAEVHLRSIRK